MVTKSQSSLGVGVWISNGTNIESFGMLPFAGPFFLDQRPDWSRFIESIFAGLFGRHETKFVFENCSVVVSSLCFFFF